MDEKERDIYINHLTRRASGARTTISTPTDATLNTDTVKRPCGTGTLGALEDVGKKADQR
jgi:hypothetical protein